jgi:hypothetical protein
MEIASAEVVRTIWIVTLAIYGVVLLVVATLLTLVVREARKIRTAVGQIWVVGQRIANNTIHIPLLARTNRVAGDILHAAGGVLGATAAIRDHAAECPGCPACVTGPGWSR